MAASMEDDENLRSEDFYTILNVDRSASKEEITGAFRRLSKIFHPDKHIDVKKKKDAENLFNKVKKAYEVLTDGNQRAIYDRCGLKGLEIDGLEVVSRTKSVIEILAELDRYQKEQEERKLQQRTNPKGTVSVGLNATDVFDRSDEEDYGAGLGGVEVSSMSVSQSVECPLTKKDTVILSGTLSSQNGNGQGIFTTVWRRLTSEKGWAEFELGIGDNLAAGLRGFRQINRRCYCVGTVSALSVPRGLKPGASFTIACQLDKNIQGSILFNAGLTSSVKTQVAYDNEKNHVSLAVQLGIPATYVQIVYSRKFTTYEARIRVAGKLGTVATFIECGCEKKITQFSWLGATIGVGVPIGITLKLRLSRGQQTFVFPIKLSEHLMPSAVFYGAFLPLLIYSAVHKLIVSPYVKEQETEDIEKQKRDHAEDYAQKKQEAESAVDLMIGTVERIVETEESKNGLIITKALYGRLLSEGDLSDDECINVTIPVQVLVKDSSLQLPDTETKTDLPGFYDPCPGVSKSLYIQYKFRNHLHQTTVKDEEPVRLPLQSHLISDAASAGV